MSTDEHQHEPLYAELSITKRAASEIEIKAEIPVAAVAEARERTVRRMVGALELPGFRRGRVPRDMAEQHFGEAAIMQEVAEDVLSHAYGHIVEDEHLDVVGRPQVTITKLAPGNPIGFTIVTAVFPEVVLPDYKKLAADERGKHGDPEKEAVSDEELAAELKRLQEMLAGGAGKEGAVGVSGDGEKKEDGDGTTAEQTTPPELTDEVVQQLGAKDLADLKDKMRTHLLLEKQQKAREKRRLAVVDRILEKAKVDIPAVFVEGELDQMVADFSARVERAGMEVDGYLRQVEKTMDDLRKEWRADAEKRAKLQLCLGEIAKKEAIEPDHEKFEREVAHLADHYKDAEPSALQAFVRAQMTNELVFRFLEGGGKHE